MDGRGHAMLGVFVVLAEIRDGGELGTEAVLLPAVDGEEITFVHVALAAFNAEEREEAVFALVLVVRPPEWADVFHILDRRRSAEEREDAVCVAAPIAEQQDISLGPLLLFAVHAHGGTVLPFREGEDESAVLVEPGEREESAGLGVVLPPPEQDVVEVFVLPVDSVERDEAVFDAVFIPVAEDQVLPLAPYFVPVPVRRLEHPEERREETVVPGVIIEGEKRIELPVFHVPVEREEAERK